MSPILTEAVAIRLAVVEALRLGFLFIQVEDDNLCVINNQALRLGHWSLATWQLDLVVFEIRELLSLFLGAQMQHIFREVNVVADKVTSLRNRLPLSLVATHYQLNALTRKDALGWWLSHSWTTPNPLLIKRNTMKFKKLSIFVLTKTKTNRKLLVSSIKKVGFQGFYFISSISTRGLCGRYDAITTYLTILM